MFYDFTSSQPHNNIHFLIIVSSSLPSLALNSLHLGSSTETESCEVKYCMNRKWPRSQCLNYICASPEESPNTGTMQYSSSCAAGARTRQNIGFLHPPYVEQPNELWYIAQRSRFTTSTAHIRQSSFMNRVNSHPHLEYF